MILLNGAFRDTQGWLGIRRYVTLPPLPRKGMVDLVVLNNFLVQSKRLLR